MIYRIFCLIELTSKNNGSVMLFLVDSCAFLGIILIFLLQIILCAMTINGSLLSKQSKELQRLIV